MINHFMSSKKLVIFHCLLCLTLASQLGCKGNKEDKNPATETTTTKADTGAWETAPEYKPLQLTEAIPEIKDLGEYEGAHAYQVGELMVVHKPTQANQIVSAQLFFIGGSQRLTANTTGIEKLALSVAVEGGTESTPKDEFNAKLDSMGASIGSFAGRDDSGIAMKTILRHFDDTWDLMVEAAFEPAMPTDVIELQRKQTLARIDSLLENPDSQVSFVATELMFKDHPYAHRQLGTREVVSEVSREELRAWQRELLQPNQMLLVVAGNVPKDKLLGKIQKSFGRLTSTREALPALPTLQSKEPAFEFVQRDLPTNYVFGLFQAPKIGDPDHAAMVLAMDYLSDRLFEEVRTKRNLTYAVSAGISGQKANYGYLYVTAVDPQTTMKVIFDEVQNLKEAPITEQQLTETLNVYITNHYMSQETNGSQAAELANSHIVTGDWTYEYKLIDALKQVKPEDIQRVSKKYLHNYHFAVVGPDESKVPTTLFEQ